ncbi:serine/threonine protein kinase [Phytophthora cinnamomi]|uniref:serine/threonine protein kinase n=1 Tax=Phytophthora cinnamomi TaxID=4785 RepID=UPI00355A669E|nr:serine/threonine protein kinase [Phytophthora cinnamomi]
MDARPPPLLHVRRQLSVALYGEVLECELPGDDEPVAVKCISLARAAEARRQMRTTREVDNPLQEQRVAELIMTNGGHRNVVQPLFHFTHQRRLYLVNELCRGGDLHSLVAARFDASSFLEEFEVLPLIHQVLEGVNYLHSTLDIAHRDLSLENVLLGRGGVCKVTDFGLSTSARTTCEAGQVGKEFYMAPEIVSGERYDPVLADVWSLGIMWFIMLTGSPLMSLASPSVKGFATVKRYGAGAVIKVWGHGHRISKNTISLLDKMLQIDPRQRISLGQVLSHPMFDRRNGAE